jgi:hypothetical protein
VGGDGHELSVRPSTLIATSDTTSGGTGRSLIRAPLLAGEGDRYRLDADRWQQALHRQRKSI